MADSREPTLPSAPAQPSRVGFPIGLTVATAIALAILIGLGAWQLQRLRWKEDLLAHIVALQNAPAQALEPVLDAAAKGRDVGFTRVRTVCPGLAAAPFVELYALKDGEPGSRLISACQVATDRYRTILVDRGFVPQGESARPAMDRANQAPIDLVGVLRVPDKAGPFTPPHQPGGRWFSRDVAAMARELGAALPAPVFLMAETSSNPEFKGLTPAPLPGEIPNRHLEYALTWFGLAAALAGVYAAVLFRRRTV